MNVVHESLLGLYQRDGKLTPEQVVAEAVDPGSVLHPYFEWDDSVAAYHHRLAQARGLIRQVKVTVRVDPEATVRVRAFSHVQPRASYVPTDQVLVSEDRDVLLEQALRELEALRRKYQGLVDWGHVLAEASKRRPRRAA